MLYTANNCAGLVKGQLVAFSGGNFIAAQPTWEIEDATGRPTPSAAAYVVGMLYESPDANGTARILVSGVITDVSLIPQGANGPYYLNSDGALQAGVPNGVLPVFCGYKPQADVFIFRPAAPEYTGHRHIEYTLSGGVFTSGANTYNFSSDSICTALLTAMPADTVVAVANNQVTGISVSGSLLTFTDIPSSTTISSGARIFATNSLVSTDSEVRAVAPAAGNSTLKVTKAFGTVYIDTDYPTTPTTNGGVCVAGISRDGITTAPVVNQLTGAGNITITNSSGIYTISDIPAGSYLDFQTINANNVLVGANATDALLTFPEGVSASVLGVCRLPALTSGAWQFKVFAWPTSSGGAGLNAAVNMLIPPANLGDVPTTVSSGGVVNSTTFVGSGGALVQAVLSTSAGAQLSAAGVYLTSITLES